MDLKSKKSIVWTGVLSVIGLGIMGSFGNCVADLAYKQGLKQGCKGCIEDSHTNNVVYGHAAKMMLDESLVSEWICGKRVTLKKNIMKRVVKANAAMEAEYEKRWFHKGDKYKCIVVNHDIRTNRHQSRIYNDSFKKPNGDPCLDKKTEKPVQCWVAAKPGKSFHEIGQAIDVKNFAQAEPFLLEQRMVGGWHGLYKDPWHFSKGEYGRKGMGSAALQVAWYGWFIKLGGK